MPHTVPPRSAAARVCAPQQATADLCLHRRHSNNQRSVSVSRGISGPGVHKVLFESLSISGGYGV